MKAPTVTSLFVYPIKAMRGTSLDAATVTRRGFVDDRRFMLVDADGRFISQREHPRLALVDVNGTKAAFIARAPGMRELEIPREPRGARRAVRIWKDTCEGISAGDEAARYFSDYLGAPCDLVFMPESTERAVDPKYGREGDIVSFADGYPVLLVSTASLDDLNSRLDVPVPMNRFRPNIVVSGTAAFEEDAWPALTIGHVAFRAPKPCARCTVPTVDQTTGERGKEPLATLASFRKRGNDVLFAMNLVPDSLGVVRVGDGVAARI
jgi:uncharacterized protein YcbX